MAVMQISHLTEDSPVRNWVIRENLIRIEKMMLEVATETDRLPVLLLTAAQQIDRRLAGQSADQAIFDSLAKALELRTGLGAPGGSPALLDDPLTSELFAQVIADLGHGDVADLTALADEIRKIISAVGDPEKAGDQLSSLKQFCLSLHRSIVSQELPAMPDVEIEFDDDLCLLR